VLDHDGGEGPQVSTGCEQIGPDYFSAMGIRLLRGRAFAESDSQTAPRVAIVDDSFARAHFKDGAALGRLIREGGDTLEVVGVVNDIRSVRINRGDPSMVYRPLSGEGFLAAKMLVSYQGPPSSVSEAIKKAASSLDASVTTFVTPIEQNRTAALAPIRLAAEVAATLGLLALTLAATGVYGVVSFAVSRRRREVGIRMALGAERSAVVRLMLWQGFRPVMYGAIVGLALATAASHLLRAVLFGIAPLDPISFGAAAAAMALVAWVAAFAPARLAARLDPAVTLRYE
jgi:ABC-type antimicrobial peptide transport system permease subunit